MSPGSGRGGGPFPRSRWRAGGEGRAEHGSFLAALAFTGMGIIEMGVWSVALALCAVTYVTGGRNQRSRNF